MSITCKNRQAAK